MPRLDPATGLKTCFHCKKPKLAEDFENAPTKPGGLSSWCRECNSERKRNSEKAHITDRKNQAEFRRENPELSLFRVTRARAKTKGIPFAITVEDIHIPNNCPICGRVLIKAEKLDSDPRMRPGGRASSPSIDKYDPPLGYTPGNVWVICLSCNSRKQNMTGEDHVALGEDHIAFGQKLIDAFKETT